MEKIRWRVTRNASLFCRFGDGPRKGSLFICKRATCPWKKELASLAQGGVNSLETFVCCWPLPKVQGTWKKLFVVKMWHAQVVTHKDDFELWETTTPKGSRTFVEEYLLYGYAAGRHHRHSEYSTYVRNSEEIREDTLNNLIFFFFSSLILLPSYVPRSEDFVTWLIDWDSAVLSFRILNPVRFSVIDSFSELHPLFGQ
jgi:hypothetical protein